MTVCIRIQEEDFSLAREWDALRQRVGGTSGAIVAFAGLVRDHARAGEPSAGEREGEPLARKEPSAGEREGKPLARKEPSAPGVRGCPSQEKVREGEPLARKISGLFLEHYPRMTESSIERIIDEARGRWPLQDVVVIHRVGELEPGDQIVLVLAASTHRGGAFAGCEFIMDMLKTKAVFWKKETRVGSEGTWIRSTGDDFERAKHWRDDGA